MKLTVAKKLFNRFGLKAGKKRQQVETERKRLEEQAQKRRQLAEAELRRHQEQAGILRGKVDSLLKVVAAETEGDLADEVDVEGNEPIDVLAAGIGKVLEDHSNVIGRVTGIRLDCRILVADDGPENQRLISSLLKEAGAEVRPMRGRFGWPAATGQSAGQ